MDLKTVCLPKQWAMITHTNFCVVFVEFEYMLVAKLFLSKKFVDDEQISLLNYKFKMTLMNRRNNNQLFYICIILHNLAIFCPELMILYEA